MNLTLHNNLRPNFMLGWVVAWNAMLVGGLVLDQVAGGRHAYFISAFTLAALGTSTLCLAIILQPRMQAFALIPGVPVAPLRRELWLLVAVTAVCGLIAPLAALFVR
jgi:hypothetical protein